MTFYTERLAVQVHMQPGPGFAAMGPGDLRLS